MSGFDSFGGGGGGRTRHGMKVILNVYDLSPANETILNYIGFGIHHSGLGKNAVRAVLTSSRGGRRRTGRDWTAALDVSPTGI